MHYKEICMYLQYGTYIFNGDIYVFLYLMEQMAHIFYGKKIHKSGRGSDTVECKVSTPLLINFFKLPIIPECHQQKKYVSFYIIYTRTNKLHYK